MAVSTTVSRSSQTPRNRNAATNVTSAIPLTKQTDPREFPPYEFVEYPKMMLQPNGKPYMDAASNEPIAVLDPEEERQFREDHPEALEVTSVGASALSASERAELEQLRALRNEGDTNEPETNRLAAVTGKHRPASRNKKVLTDKSGKPLPKALD